MYDTEKLSERIAKLAGGVAVIKVSVPEGSPCKGYNDSAERAQRTLPGRFARLHIHYACWC